MSAPDPASHERIDELLADRALQGLEAAEAAELAALLAAQGRPESDDLERAAAALDLGLGGDACARLPAALRRRLDGAGQAWCAGLASAAERGAARPGAPPAASPWPPPLKSAPAREPAPARTPGGGAGPAWWLFAAAAVLALVGWWPRLSGGAEAPGDGAPTASLAARRAELLSHPGVLERSWKATEFAPGAGGDVVWDQAHQAGFLHFTGLAANDPSKTQYQLWIFDEAQEHPIDGGVFDAGPAGELIVPIDAKLGVARPTLFAITIEKPGGVVVSDQQRIALLAEV